MMGSPFDPGGKSNRRRGRPFGNICANGSVPARQMVLSSLLKTGALRRPRVRPDRVEPLSVHRGGRSVIRRAAEAGIIPVLAAVPPGGLLRGAGAAVIPPARPVRADRAIVVAAANAGDGRISRGGGVISRGRGISRGGRVGITGRGLPVVPVIAVIAGGRRVI